MEKLKKVIRLLEETGKLPSEYKPHKLSGQYAGSWECHIMPDWLLIWKQFNDELVLVMTILVLIVMCSKIDSIGEEKYFEKKAYFGRRNV